MKHLVVLFCGLGLASAVRADDPELIPLRPTPMPCACAPVAYPRTSMYDRWQYYGVDRSGHFRPRVVLDYPDTAYLHNGAAYPLLPVRQRDFIPMMTN